MNRSMVSGVLMAALAVAALGGAAAAHAASGVVWSVGVPVVTAAPVYVSRPVDLAEPQDGDEWRYEQERAWRHACRAARWDPHLRYMPGQRAWRHGTVYVATGLSASVWNVNSPPEWTPRYWVATNCTSPRPWHAREWQTRNWR